MEKMTLITAHAGAEHTRDNTVESVRTLAGCGADIVELDVREYRGVLVMAHDVPKCMEECDFQEVQHAMQEHSLEAGFRAVREHPGVKMNIDLKQGDLVERIADLARECGVEDRLLFTGAISPNDLKCAQERGLPLWYNNDGLPEGMDWIEGIRDLNCQALNLEYTDVDERLLECAQMLSVWTVDDEKMLKKLIGAGVKSITTHKPILARRIRDYMQKQGEKPGMKIVTFNIRGDFGVDGQNNFCYRKPMILKKIEAEKPDIIGFQEVMPHVAVWLRENLKDYYVVGCSREEKLDGEQTTVAYRKDLYNLIEMRTFWLSPTPYVPASRYAQQSICPRTTTELVLMEYATGKVFRVVNTHLDHEGTEARRLGLGQILEHLEQVQLFPDAPAILMGDFNAPPESEELKVFDQYPEYVNATEGVGVTFHGFMKAQEPEYIDYIYLKGAISAQSMEKWTDEEDGVYLSDHYPVCVKASLQ